MRVLFQKLHVTGIYIVIYLIIRITIANTRNEEINSLLFIPTIIFFGLVFIVDPLLNSERSMKKFYMEPVVLFLGILIIVALEYFTFWFE